jgi:hypothetical protein
LICLKAIVLTIVFIVAIVEPVVAPADIGTKDSRHGSVHVDE